MLAHSAVLVWLMTVCCVVIPLCWCGKVCSFIDGYVYPGVGVANISGCIDGVDVSFF